MFGFPKAKTASQRNPHAAVEASVRHAQAVWDSADVEKRTSLLKPVIDIQDDRLFLAYVHAPWTQIPESVRLKLVLAVMAHEDAAALSKRTDRLGTLGRKAGEAVAQCFSAEQFSEFFGQKPFAPNWTFDEALGVWYCLGRFCFLISVGTLESVREADGHILIESGEEALMATWKMRESTMRRFDQFIETKLASVYSIYKLINNSEMFGRFFALFISEILGHAQSFSPEVFSRGMLAQLLQGEELEMDPVLETEVSSMFVKVKRAIHELIFTQLAEIYANLAIYLTPPGTIGCGFTSFANGTGSI